MILLFVAWTNLPFPVYRGNREIVTFEQLYWEGITNYVGETILIKTNLRYRNPQLTVRNDKLFKYMKSKFIANDGDRLDRASFFLVGERLKKYEIDIRDPLDNPYNSFDLKPYSYWFSKVLYFFDKKWLRLEGKEYLLEGRLQYRSWRKSTVRSTEAIRQANMPVYWSQTFEFVIDNIYEI
jgi:hypothetical protein